MEQQTVFFMLIACGGAVGAVLRALVGTYIGQTDGFPWSTLVVNFVGCLLISTVFFATGGVSPEMKAFLMIGIFGAFTTMSSFTLETICLFDDGHLGAALANVLLNLGLCFSAGWAGKIVGGLMASV
jgi:CrcB protein